MPEETVIVVRLKKEQVTRDIYGYICFEKDGIIYIPFKSTDYQYILNKNSPLTIWQKHHPEILLDIKTIKMDEEKEEFYFLGWGIKLKDVIN